MQTKENIERLLRRVTFNFFGHSFNWRVMAKGDGFLIQVGTTMEDVLTKEQSFQKGGKHYISQHAVDSEVMLKAFKACKDFVNHEIHEAFRIDNVQVFDPHVDLESFIDAMTYMKRDSRAGSWIPQRPMNNV